MSLGRKINSLLAIFGLNIVKTSMLYDWQKGGVHSQQEVQLPHGAVDYLHSENPRLLELRSRYAAFQENVSIPLVWTDDYAQSYALKSFRGDNCYVWQIADQNCAEINYCLTAYYTDAVDSLGVLQKNSEDSLFGVHAYKVNEKKISRDLLDSTLELNFLEKHLALSTITNLTILDIGAGYGRLACRTTNTLSNISKYICADAVPESTFLCEYHIRFRELDDKVAVVPLDEIEEQLQSQKIDLAVNIHSFSECSLEAIQWWLKLLVDNKVKYLFIVPNASDHGGEKIALNNGDDFSFLLQKYSYKLLVQSPKYHDPVVQKYGISPTWYFLFELQDKRY
jgi:hypothetical protein